jgi:nucleotide-binding universal stress UspA family protein
MVPDADSPSDRPAAVPGDRPAPASIDRPALASNPFRQVLVGWDGSPGSVAALRTAAAIVGDGPGRVIALAVLPRARHLEQEPGPAGTDADGGHARQTFEVTRSAIAATVPARISLHTEEGRDAARALCDHAAEHGFDLMVLGRHGDGGVLHARLGHVAEAAARASRIPILLVGAG